MKSAALQRLAWLLNDDGGRNKTAFVQSGGLQLVQELGEEPDSPFHAVAMTVVSHFPQELVNRYSPAYNRALLEKLTIGNQHMQEHENLSIPGEAPTEAEKAMPNAIAFVATEEGSCSCQPEDAFTKTNVTSAVSFDDIPSTIERESTLT